MRRAALIFSDMAEKERTALPGGMFGDYWCADDDPHYHPQA
jgi:hypothetical protein